jgi:DNA-binding response OmpR family regulator
MSESKRKRVLLVEDTDSVQLMVKRWLTGDGYDVDVASDGREALEQARSNVPDLILLDVMMPGLNGYAVCRELRESEQTKKTPIIIITALPTAVDSKEGKLSGANEVLVKPLNREDILRRVRAYLAPVFM